jgi:hypothetical protein
MIRTSNQKARQFVQNRQEFKGANTFAESHGQVYIVFSYGHHWILFVWKDGVWYENKDKYSATTSKHRSQLHPLTDTVKMSHEEIRKMY